jgi:hypothetical protein
VQARSSITQALGGLALIVTLAITAYQANRPHGCRADFHFQRPDIATALTAVLPVLAAKLLDPKSDSTQLGLRGARLDGFAFDGLRLERFNLTGIQFRDSSLNDSDFRGARLIAADFTRACLHHADFRLAKLAGAQFRGAQLQGARFTQAAYDQAALSPAQKHQVHVVPG